MDASMIAALSGLLGIIGGFLTAAFTTGRASARVEISIKALEDKVDYICGELSRRVEQLENQGFVTNGYFPSGSQRQRHNPSRS